MKYQFGEKIREIRAKITMKEVAGKAVLSESLASQIESNKAFLAIDTLLKINDILDMDSIRYRLSKDLLNINGKEAHKAIRSEQ